MSSSQILSPLRLHTFSAQSSTMQRIRLENLSLELYDPILTDESNEAHPNLPHSTLLHLPLEVQDLILTNVSNESGPNLPDSRLMLDSFLFGMFSICALPVIGF
jgi:hypothetical protein